RSPHSSLCVVATASHVLSHAHYWEEPIRLHHHATGQTLVLKPDKRAIDVNEKTDTSAILFEAGDLSLPSEVLELTKKDHYLKPGVEVGWLGYPAVAGANLCFFSGHISAYIESESAYLVDGVAINGVSGGPAFSRGYTAPAM